MAGAGARAAARRRGLAGREAEGRRERVAAVSRAVDSAAAGAAAAVSLEADAATRGVACAQEIVVAAAAIAASRAELCPWHWLPKLA